MKNHEMVNGRLLQINKPFSQLKQAQKEQIEQWMYEAYKSVCPNPDNTPNKEDDAAVIAAVMKKIEEQDIWIPEHEIVKHYRSKKLHLSKRLKKEHDGTEDDDA